MNKDAINKVVRNGDAKRLALLIDFCEGYPNSNLANMGSLGDVIDDHAKNAARLMRERNERGQWHPYDKDDKGTWPKDEQPVLTCRNGRNFEAQEGKRFRYEGKTIFAWLRDLLEPTHWMPITPPKDKT